MILFGTRGVTTKAANGHFYCPSCASENAYVHKKVRRFFTLYFIPVIPLDLVGEYIECQVCKDTFKKEVLAHLPQPGSGEIEAEFQRAIKHVMVLMALADGQVEEAEIQSMRHIFSRVAGRDVSEQDLRDEAKFARAGSQTVSHYLGEVSPYINDLGKEMIIKAIFFVAVADGVFQDAEKQLLADTAKALEVSSAHLKGILAEVQAPPSQDSLPPQLTDDDARY